MRIDCALLCDAVTVRDGLLHILGGGVTRLHRGSFPTPLNVALALRVMVHPTETDRSHKIEARLITADGKDVEKVDIEFGVSDTEGIQPGEEVSVAIPVPLHPVRLDDPGSYSFEILIDGTHVASLPFIATDR